jgi:Arylsulfotransferase (ASST)
MKISLRMLGPSAIAVAALAFGSARAVADTPDAGAPPEQQPIGVTILKTSPDTAPGLIFLTPNGGGPTGAHGAEIVDDRARPVWFAPLPSGESAFDLRVQRYHGEPVLTWIQSKGAFSTGPTTDYIADRHYNVIANVTAGNGLTADIHEFFLTREGTALIPIYNTVSRDLSSVGGPAAGLVTEGVVQEIDIANGHVLFEWHSLDHIGLDESHAPLPTSSTAAWDYFHLNAVSVDEDGNLLIDARNTWAAYRLDRHSGRVIWRLGGKKTDFALGPDVAFAWQHNPTAVDDHGLIRIFDNEAGPAVLPYSRVIWVRHDDVKKTATLERWLKHPDGLSAASQGNAQGLENGDTFVGWGQLPRFSEFDKGNNLLFDAELPAGYNSYRAYRHEWIGRPQDRPTAVAQRQSNGDTLVHAVWNGATEVARWDVVDASGEADRNDDRGWPDRDERRRVASGEWDGLDTTIAVDEFVSSLVVVARDRAGREIGRSAATQVQP